MMLSRNLVYIIDDKVLSLDTLNGSVLNFRLKAAIGLRPTSISKLIMVLWRLSRRVFVAPIKLRFYGNK